MLSRRYKQQIVRCTLLFLAGTALQLSIGNVDASFLAYPWGLVLMVNFLYLLVLMYANRHKWKFVLRLYDRLSYLTSLASMLILTLLFGLIPQDASIGGLIGLLGFHQMSSSWIFALFLFHFMTIIGLKAIEDIHHWKKRSLPAVLMHVSFFVILVAAVFGSGEKLRVRVTALEGHPVHTGLTTDGKQVELPFMIRLKDFSLEEYSPKIHLFSQNQLSEESMEVTDEGSEGQLGPWHVSCLQYLDMAGRMSEDSAYVSMKHVGATTAVYLKVADGDGKAVAEGWVSEGSFVFAGSTLPLPDGSEVVMPRREVKKYLSEVEIWEGEEKSTHRIAVNEPASIGSWSIYQSGYDSTRGRWSTTSVLECVKDGGYMFVHIAMWTILLAGGMMCLMTRKKKKEDKR